jgi:hypothetical protein
VKLDGVVTMVDSKHVLQHLNEVKPRFVVNEAVEQVAYADRIILNKVNFDVVFECIGQCLSVNFFIIPFIYRYLYLHPSEALEELMFLTIYSNLLADRFGV